MNNLPFTLDPAFDYILNEADRQKFAPLQVTDECWWADEGQWNQTTSLPHTGFGPNDIYRRRKSGWVSVLQSLPKPDDSIYVSNGQTLGTYQTGCRHPVRLEGQGWTHWMPWTIPALPQPPKPAAEVAFESLWPELQKQVGLTKDSTFSLFKVGWDAAKDHKEAL